MDRYVSAYRRAIDEPESFWGEAAQDVFWFKKWDSVLANGRPFFYRWFAGGMVNTCYNALDLHLSRGRSRKVALIYHSAVTGTVTKLTYLQLHDLVARFAGALISRGVKKGDRVMIYMPMIPETVIAMLACARIGAVHAVVAGGLASAQLAALIDDAQPRLIVAASCGIERKHTVPYKPLLDDAIVQARHKPCGCIIFQRPQQKADLTPERDLDWKAAMKNADPIGCVPVAATDPLYILYSAGATGHPKGVVRDNGGHMVALKWSMKAIYDIDEDDVWWTVSDVSSVMGHSCLVYGPLLKGCTTILFEGNPGGTPDAGTFWQIISEHKVAAMVAPATALQDIKREDPAGKLAGNYDFSTLRNLFLASECKGLDTVQWCERHLNVPVIDHWWQAESGWAIAAGCRGLGPRSEENGSMARAVPGWNLQVIGDNGRPIAPGKTGALVVKLPMPPGAFPTLWRDDNRFLDSYMREFPGYYKTAATGCIDDKGYVHVAASNSVTGSRSSKQDGRDRLR